MILFVSILAAGIVLCLWCVVRSGGKSDEKIEKFSKKIKINGDEGWIKPEEPDYSGVNIQELGFEYAEELIPDEYEIESKKK